MADNLKKALRRYVRAELELSRFLHGHMIGKIAPPKMYQAAFEAAEKEADEALDAVPLEIRRAMPAAPDPRPFR